MVESAVTRQSKRRLAIAARVLWEGATVAERGVTIVASPSKRYKAVATKCKAWRHATGDWTRRERPVATCERGLLAMGSVTHFSSTFTVGSPQLGPSCPTDNGCPHGTRTPRCQQAPRRGT